MLDNEIVTLWENCIKMHDEGKKFGVNNDTVVISIGVAKETAKLLERMKLNIEDYAETITDLEMRLKESNAEIELKTMDIESLTSERDALQEMVEEQKAEIERLQDIIISNDEERLSYSATMMKKEQELMHAERIRGLEAEIERLQNAYKQCAWERDVFSESLEEAHSDIKEHFVTFKIEQVEELKKAKSEARKDFAERLKKCETKVFGSQCRIIPLYCIDNLLKEMEGEE